MNVHGWILLAALAAGGLAMVFGAVFLLDEQILGVHVGKMEWALLVGASALVLALVLRLLVARGRLRPSMVTVLAANLALGFVGLLAVDLGFTLYLAQSGGGAAAGIGRANDSHILIGEYYPDLYYPTEQNFRLHKPGLIVEATSFGIFYDPSMLASPTLTDEVLKLRRTRIAINGLGLREHDPIAETRIFALGDSLTFGWQVEARQSWVGRLEALLDQPIYNLGVHDASPRQEVLLLKNLLAQHADEMRIDRVLWLIYEGNDLEDSYAIRRPDASGHRWARALHQTILQPLAEVPDVLKAQSFITRLRNGEARLRGDERDRHASIDGVTLAHPLYRSAKLGPRLFYPLHIERAQQGPSYVHDHPNRPALEQTLDEMAALAREADFRVTVILAPTATRLHGRYFEDFPQLSERPYFLDFVRELALARDFEVVDLYALLAPDAGKELFYFRDDDHWNLLGNRRAADLIAEHAFGVSHERLSTRPRGHHDGG